MAVLEFPPRLSFSNLNKCKKSWSKLSLKSWDFSRYSGFPSTRNVDSQVRNAKNSLDILRLTFTMSSKPSHILPTYVFPSGKRALRYILSTYERKKRYTCILQELSQRYTAVRWTLIYQGKRRDKEK